MWSLENQPKLDTANMFKGNPQGLAAQSITPWVLDMLLKENLPFSDQKWRLATKRYEMLNKGLGLDPPFGVGHAFRSAASFFGGLRPCVPCPKHVRSWMMPSNSTCNNTAPNAASTTSMFRALRT